MKQVIVHPDGSMTVISEEMQIPVQCTHCGQVYDLCKGEPLSRYADCTVFQTPCCKRTVDDRTWKSLPDFRRL